MIPDLNLFVARGADFSYLITVYINRVLKDLTGYTVTAHASRWYGIQAAFSLNPAILDAATGKLTITLSDAETALLEEGKYVFNVFINSASNIKTRIAKGHLIVTPSVGV